jgi:hypothetical protein
LAVLQPVLEMTPEPRAIYAEGEAVAIIAKRPATDHQRQVALERGRAWTAAHVPSSQLDPHRRYIAVDTQINSVSSLQAQRDVMIFDTRAQKVVGKSVYDLETPPTVGSIVRFEKNTAQYIGTGFASH